MSDAAPRITLFVEGGDDVKLPRRQEAIMRLWQQVIVGAFGLRPVHRVIPIGKPALIALNRGRPDAGRIPPISGAGESLDQLLVREYKRNPFDVAVVLWDLMPPTDREARPQRCVEVLQLYRGLAQSNVTGFLPAWKAAAQRRLDELEGRCPRSELLLVENSILAVCMEPMFEALLVRSEAAVRRVLGVAGRRVPAWPHWRSVEWARKPDALLKEVLVSLEELQPVPHAIQKIRGPMKTHKNDWGIFFLEALMNDSEGRQLILEDGLTQRLRQLLGR